MPSRTVRKIERGLHYPGRIACLEGLNIHAHPSQRPGQTEVAAMRGVVVAIIARQA